MGGGGGGGGGVESFLELREWWMGVGDREGVFTGWPLL
jgi:hypothetical protein